MNAREMNCYAMPGILEIPNKKADCLKNITVKHHFSDHRTTIITMMLNIITEYYMVDTFIIFAQTRQKVAVTPRHQAMYFIDYFLLISLEDIGKVFNRNHSTVISAKRSVINQCDVDMIYKNHVENIESLIMTKLIETGLIAYTKMHKLNLS